MEYFLCVLGMVLVIEGMPYFGFPEKMKAFMQYVQEQDDTTLRVMGGLTIAIGVLIVYLARNGLCYL
ncbi:MAG: DUF2065 domain-containing protein [Desulfomonile tiedjei]|nr:DUF2065 domain-containing protein [Desulfomonile tiedjei]